MKITMLVGSSSKGGNSEQLADFYQPEDILIDCRALSQATWLDEKLKSVLYVEEA